MTYEEVFNKVFHTLENYDLGKLKTIEDMMDLNNDRLNLSRLNSIYPDYISLCNSPEFGRLRQKYCI